MTNMAGSLNIAAKTAALFLLSQISLYACGPGQLFGPTLTPTATFTLTPSPTHTPVPPTATRTPTRTPTRIPSPTTPPAQYGHYVGKDPNNSFYHSADVAFDYTEDGISGFRLTAKEVQYTSPTTYTTLTCYISQPAEVIYPVVGGYFQIGSIEAGSLISANISGNTAAGSYFLVSCGESNPLLGWSGEFVATKK